MPRIAEAGREPAAKTAGTLAGRARAVIIQFVRPEQVTKRWLVVYALRCDEHIHELERFDCREAKLPTHCLVQTLVGRGERRFIIDLAELTRIDSCGVGQLVAAWCCARRAGGMLAVMGVTPRVRGVLEILLLDQVLPICTSLQQALDRVERHAPVAGRPGGTLARTW